MPRKQESALLAIKKTTAIAVIPGSGSGLEDRMTTQTHAVTRLPLVRIMETSISKVWGTYWSSD